MLLLVMARQAMTARMLETRRHISFLLRSGRAEFRHPPCLRLVLRGWHRLPVVVCRLFWQPLVRVRRCGCAASGFLVLAVVLAEVAVPAGHWRQSATLAVAFLPLRLALCGWQLPLAAEMSVGPVPCSGLLSL